MKLFFILLLLVIVISPAFGQSLSDRTGLVNRLDVEVNEQSFEVESVSNYDVSSYQFDRDEKRLTIFVDSALENNLGELVIPQEFIGGNFTFYLNDHPFNPVVKSSDRISFVTLNFTGKGTNKIDIIATNVPSDLEAKPQPDNAGESPSEGGGCLIATATYGTEMAPEIQLLREIRDQKLMKTEYGKSFMDSFNKLYYSFSPTVADYEREHPFFKDSVKLFLTPMISSLSILSYAPMDDDVQVLGTGIGIIVLNLGMYFAVPTILVMRLKR